MDIKIQALPSWILMWDSTPEGTAGVFQRGYYQKKKGNIAELSMVLAAYVFLNYCRS